LEWLAGVVVLWEAVRLAGGGRWVYLMLWGYFLVSVVDGAPLYGPLRFASGVLLALLIHRRLTHGSSALPGFGLAAVGTILLLGYSPEQGIAFSVATVLYCLWNWHAFGGKRFFGAGLALFVAMNALALFVADRIGALDTLKSYSSGGAALPLVPSPASIAVLLLLLVAAGAAWGSARRGVRRHPLLYVLLVSVCTAPAGFSRCFEAALVGQTLGGLLIGLIVLTEYQAVWRWAKYGFLVLIVGSAAWDQIRLSRPQLREALGPPGRVLEQPASEPLVRLLAPFGWDQRTFEPAAGVRVLSGRYAYYQPLLNAQVPAEKIRELEADAGAPLLLPNALTSACNQNDGARRRRLRAMLDALYLPPTAHVVAAGQPLCDYIELHYIPSTLASPSPDYTVWVRR